MMKEPMKMLIFFVALCFLLFCSAKHLCFTLRARHGFKVRGSELAIKMSAEWETSLQEAPGGVYLG